MQRILIVDDAPVIRKVARRIFEGLHLEVQDVESAEEALEACRTALPDGILVDSYLPQQTGISFVRELRNLPGGNGPRVVFVLLENDLGQIAKVMHAGADDYILKPFDRLELAQKFSF
jgi:two-component system chemotaxis response regulator CheY